MVTAIRLTRTLWPITWGFAENAFPKAMIEHRDESLCPLVFRGDGPA
jgi:hypothetical protein